MMKTEINRHPIKARRVQFNFEQTPYHWIPNDPFASHLINGIHMILPAGELWFCRIYNKALPMVTDDNLRADVQGFIRQEAIHARAHSSAHLFLAEYGFETESFTKKINFLFEQLLGDSPLDQPALKKVIPAKQWLITRVGVIAAIEHFTGFLGQWAMDNTSWDQADPVMADLFKWHLAEEVEHRTVAFDLYQHLCQTEAGFYLSRQALMALVFPLFIKVFMDGYRHLAKQDNNKYQTKLAQQPIWRLLLEMERIGNKSGNVPSFSAFMLATSRWVSPNFHPIHEGSTEQALAYLAKSPAALAAETRH